MVGSGSFSSPSSASLRHAEATPGPWQRYSALLNSKSQGEGRASSFFLSAKEGSELRFLNRRPPFLDEPAVVWVGQEGGKAVRSIFESKEDE